MVDIMSMDDIPGEITFEFEKTLEKNERAPEPRSPTFIQVHGMMDEPQKPGEICKFFLKGTCMKGNTCQFRHSKNERAVVCKHWLRGLCKKGDLCEFLHEYDLAKMPECYFFSKFGECSNPECMYLHIPPEEKMKECPWFARGFCKHGPRCRHKHVKKVACENYLLGFCPDGPKCKFGHPKYELPKEDNDNPARKARTPMICHKCGGMGHKAASCQAGGPFKEQMAPIPTYSGDSGGPMSHQQQQGKPGLRPLESVTCYKCGQMGHYANKCPNKRIPPPPGGYQLPPGGDPMQQDGQPNYGGGGYPPNPNQQQGGYPPNPNQQQGGYPPRKPFYPQGGPPMMNQGPPNFPNQNGMGMPPNVWGPT